MACRLLNLHTHPLHIDLRGGETLRLAPNQTSRALLEELLYENQHLRDWEAAGWVVRLPARLAEAQQESQAATPPEETEEHAHEPEDEQPEEGESEEHPHTRAPKRRSRRPHR